MTIFDSHCHPQFPQYDEDREEMIERTRLAGIGMICVGTDLETSKQGIELADRHENIWATVGLHPNDIGIKIRDKEEMMIDFEKLLSEPKVVAIGEVGLDYYRTPEPEKQKKQKEFFKQFIDLAIKHSKPIIIHARDAGKGSMGRVHKDVIEILESYKLKANKLAGVSHSFTGNLEEAKKYIDQGIYLGFNGIITFPPPRKAMAVGSTKSAFGQTKSAGAVPGMYDEIVKFAPLENILVETDAPFLSPEPYRGRRGEPLYVQEVIKKIAGIKGTDKEEVLKITADNCRKLFNINS